MGARRFVQGDVGVAADDRFGNLSVQNGPGRIATAAMSQRTRQSSENGSKWNNRTRAAAEIGLTKFDPQRPPAQIRNLIRC
jgi:hypothetical protein